MCSEEALLLDDERAPDQKSRHDGEHEPDDPENTAQRRNELWSVIRVEKIHMELGQAVKEPVGFLGQAEGSGRSDGALT